MLLILAKLYHHSEMVQHEAVGYHFSIVWKQDGGKVASCLILRAKER
jgi:hypothetical protein